MRGGRLPLPHAPGACTGRTGHRVLATPLRPTVTRSRCDCVRERGPTAVLCAAAGVGARRLTAWCRPTGQLSASAAPCWSGMQACHRRPANAYRRRAISGEPLPRAHRTTRSRLVSTRGDAECVCDLAMVERQRVAVDHSPMLPPHRIETASCGYAATRCHASSRTSASTFRSVHLGRNGIPAAASGFSRRWCGPAAVNDDRDASRPQLRGESEAAAVGQNQFDQRDVTVAHLL